MTDISVSFVGPDQRLAIAARKRAEAAAAGVAADADSAHADALATAADRAAVATAKTDALAAIGTQQAASVAAVNTAGTTQVAAVNTAGATQVAAVSALLPDLQNAGGNRNLWPDPFWTDSSIAAGFRASLADSPYSFGNGWTGFSAPTAASPYQAGQVLVRPSTNTGVASIRIFLDNLGLAAGDVFQISQEAAFLTANSATSGTYASLQFTDRSGVNVGAAIPIFVPTVGNPLNATYRAFTSPNLTVPVGAADATVTYPLVVSFALGVCSMQLVKGTALAKPVQRLAIPDAANRVKALEDHDPGNLLNNVTMRRTTYASASAASLVGSIGPVINTFSNNSGYGNSYLAAACPATGFNVIANQWNWTPSADTGVARLIAIVRTCATGSNPLNAGKTIAWGYIDTDPTAGNAGSEPIQLFDPITGAPKTVMPSDLLDLMGIAVISVNKFGGTTPVATQLFVSYGTFSNADPALPGFQATSGSPGLHVGWSLLGPSNQTWIATLLLAVSPLTAVKTPSPAFASSIAALVDEPPNIIAMPKKVYCVVGREASLYYDAVQQRDAKRTNFRAGWSGAVPAGSGAQEERIKYVPTAAGTNTLTLQAFRGDLLSSSATCAFVAIAASAAAGNKVIHCMGDSLIENGGMIGSLKAIEASQAVTSLTFIGSHGNPGLLNDGYSGQPLGVFRAATIPGVGPNPFYNPSTLDFDYAYWMANAGSGFAAANFVFIEGGGVDVGSPTSDAAASAAAISWSTTAEFIVASIRAANPSAKIVIYTKEAGPVPGEEPSPVYGPTWRVRRNWRILAAKQISQFSGREASGIYVTPTAAAIDPENGWGRTFTPRSSAVTANLVTYATYAAMQADLTKGNATLAFATDAAAYFVKVGPNGVGRWRDARLEDGFIMRHTDTVHYANGAIQVAEANWAVIKNFG